MNILCVIDLQPEFVDFQNESELINNACVLVEEFKNKNEPVILVEYDNCHSPTSPDIKNLVQEYPLTTIVKKYADGGGVEIKKELFNKNWEPTSITVCGCNLSYCVKETVLQLRTLYPKIPITLEMSAVRDSKYSPNYKQTTQFLKKNKVNINGSSPFSKYEY